MAFVGYTVDCRHRLSVSYYPVLPAAHCMSSLRVIIASAMFVSSCLLHLRPRSPAPIAAVMPYFGVRFGAYDILRRWHIRLANGTVIPAQFSAAYGFFAGFAASGLTFPFEVVRRRAMLGAVGSNPLTAVPQKSQSAN